MRRRHGSEARSRSLKAISRRLVVLVTIAGLPIIGHPGVASAAISVAPDSGTWGVDGRIRAMVRIGDVLYMGGKFSAAVSPDGSTTVPRTNLAAIDVTTGEVLPWAPLANGDPQAPPPANAGAVFGMETDGSQLFIAGDFKSITWTASDGVTQTTTPRAYFASIAPDQYGTLLPLTANSNDRQRAFALSGTTLYIGGEFSKIDGQTRTRLAAIDLASNPAGALLPWSPTADAAVISMGMQSSGNVVIGGSFGTVDGDATQSAIAVLDQSGALAPWASHPIDKVLSLIVQNDNVYAGLGGHGNELNGYDGAGNLRWTRSTDGDVQAVAFCQGQVIAGGHFGRIGAGHKFPKLAAVDPVSGLVDVTWKPKPAGGTFGVWSLLGTPNKLFAGGDFTSVGGQPANHYAQFSTGPAITGISPTSGIVGASVQISGKSLLGATSVDFNGTPASFVVNADNLITTTVPSGATSGPIHVTTAEGTATSADSFTVVAVITDFSPTSGKVGDNVVITGTSFTGATKVKIGGTTATFSVDSDTQITATVPASAPSGPIKVTTPSGSVTSASNFTVLPAITSLSPGSGPVDAAVSINGTSLLGATSVSFNGTPVSSFVVVSRNLITTTVPAGATTGSVTVTTPDGTATSPAPFAVLPKITGFTPDNGSAGTVVIITGTSFTGATTVAFNGMAATTFTVDTDLQITATVPSGATTGPISVTTPDGTATSATNFTVPFAIADFSPPSGPVGTAVTINGAGFTGATKVKIGGTTATFSVDSDTQITATVPASAPSGPISVTTPAGTVTSATSFVVTPTVTDLSPKIGAVDTVVTITGTSLLGASDVSFNGTPASFVVNSRTQIVATVPAGATTGFVTVTTPDGVATSPMTFKLLPKITGFTPDNGSAGTVVIITGYNFTGATKVKFNGKNAPIFTVDSDTQITVTVPSGSTTGPITVVTPDGSAISTTSFTVV